MMMERIVMIVWDEERVEVCGESEEIWNSNDEWNEIMIYHHPNGDGDVMTIIRITMILITDPHPDLRRKSLAGSLVSHHKQKGREGTYNFHLKIQMEYDLQHT